MFLMIIDKKKHVEMPPALATPPPQPEGNIAQFKQFITRGKKTAELKQRIAVFLAKLSQATRPQDVKYLCEEEKSWFFDKYKAAATRNTYMTAYRHAIQDCFNSLGIPEGLASERETTKGLVVQHLAMNYMIGLTKDYEATRTQSKTKTAEQRDNLTAFDLTAAIEKTEAALNSDDWRELAAALIFSVQARPSDMLASGQFKAISKYQVEFTSKAKKRGAAVSGHIWSLVDSATFIDAFSRLRRCADVLALKSKTLAEVDSGKNSTLNRAINRIFADVVPPPHGEKALSAKNLRAAGVNVAYHLYGRDNQSIGRFAERQLLHDTPGTAANYEDYYCTQSGKRIAAIGIRQDSPLTHKPASETRSNLTADKALLDVIRDAAEWGQGTNTERLERIIAAARHAQQLERALAATEARLERLQSESQQIREEDIVPLPSQPVTREDSIRAMTNTELLGSRKRGAAEEKLRRTVEAIQEYNAGRELSEQIAINKGSLRKITKVKAQSVNEWVDANAAEIEAYTEAQGHSYRQNVGKDLSVIKWSEAAYGAYEWPEQYFR